MIPVVAMLASPAPSWCQFKEPVLTEIRGGGPHDWGATFSKDMLEVYWVVSYGNSIWDIWGAHRESIDASWQDTQPLDVVNTARVDNAPHLSDDGLTLTFASNGRADGYGGLDLWQTTRASRDDPWQEPVNMGPTINTRRNEGNATFSTDDLELIFNSGCVARCSPSTLRRSTRETLADEWTTPEEMTSFGRGDRVGSAAHPSLSPDGLSLYFNKTGSYGDWDVFVSKRPSLDAPFGEGENLGAPISTSGRDTAVRVAPDGSLYYSRWSGNWGIWHAEAESMANALGDFDADGVLDVSDIDDLMLQVAADENPLAYDLNNDGLVNTEDIHVWVKNLANTWIGDANLDGEFNSGDLINILAAGTYEVDVEAGWASGDFDGSGRFDSGDLIFALADGGYEAGPRAAVASVPEPTTIISLLTAVIALAGVSQSRRSCV